MNIYCALNFFVSENVNSRYGDQHIFIIPLFNESFKIKYFHNFSKLQNLINYPIAFIISVGQEHAYINNIHVV